MIDSEHRPKPNDEMMEQASISNDLFSLGMRDLHYENDNFSAREWAELLLGVIAKLKDKNVDEIEEYIYEAPHTDEFDQLFTLMARVGWHVAEGVISDAIYDRDYEKLKIVGIEPGQLSGTTEGLKELSRRMFGTYKALEEIEDVFRDAQRRSERLRTDLAGVNHDMRREIGDNDQAESHLTDNDHE